MAVSYDPSQPTDKDWMRWRVADISTSNGIRQDAEYVAILSEYGSKQEAAWRMAESIGAEFALLAVDSKMGQLQFQYSKRAEWYEKLSAKLKAETAESDGIAPWFGGTLKSDKELQEDNDDRVEPSFARNQFSTPGFELTAETGGLSTSV